MLRSLYSAVSGLDAHQQMMDVIGNDIANINTTGYKSSSVVFQDLLSQTIQGSQLATAGSGGINPSQIGLGVKVGGISADFTQGAAQQTGRPLDISIQGDGFLIGQSNGQTLYTRAGSLNVDSTGHLVAPDGTLIQGWQASAAGAVSTAGPLTGITLTAGSSIAATPTTAIGLTGNVGDAEQLDGSGNPIPASAPITVFDQLGNAHALRLTFNPVVSTAPPGVNVAVEAFIDGGTTPVDTGVSVAFDATGSNPVPASLSLAGTATALGVATLNVSLAGVTAAAIKANSTPTIQGSSQNGVAPGVLQSFNVTANGTINGVYSNGVTQAVGRLAMASFTNPGGLERAGGTMFRASSNSGLAQVGTAGSAGRGVLTPGSLEMSNVDLASEFTRLIEAQRGFEANGKIITTSDQMLQDLINLK